MTVEKVSATVDSAKDEAIDVSETTRDVIQEVETQERAVRELADCVDELSTNTNLE